MTRPIAFVFLCFAFGAMPALAVDPTPAPAEAAPTTPATPQPSSDTKPPSQPAAATPPVSSASAAKAKASQDLNENEKRLLSQGYRLEVHDGQRTFCRREVVVGSRFEKKVCGTVEQLAASRQTSRDVTEESQRRGTNPIGN